MDRVSKTLSFTIVLHFFYSETRTNDNVLDIPGSDELVFPGTHNGKSASKRGKIWHFVCMRSGQIVAMTYV